MLWPSSVRAAFVHAALVVFAVLLTACGTDNDERPAHGSRVGTGASVTLAQLIEQMTDLDHLARGAAPPYETLQFSSWDRRSVSPSDATEAGWFANRDWDEYLSEVTNAGRTERVMAEVFGAGALVRIWAADPKGTLRIYVDDFSSPTIEMPMQQLLTGGDPRFPDPFAYVAARGHNLYFPVTFSECLRVTTDAAPDAQHYYHVNVRRYEDGTEVEPWSAAAHERNQRQIDAVAASLREARDGARAEGNSESAEPPATIDAPSGGGVIRRLTIETDASPAELRGAVLAISFDGIETVRTPLGDFFGTGPGTQPHQTLAVSTTDGRLTSYFPMPFERTATVDIEGLDAQAGGVQLEWELDAAPFDEQSLYFHARWGTTGVVESQPKRDFSLASLSGSGVYVGTHLVVDNPINEWWGEGDEKIYVDGDERPTWFGTGTEDYFGYAFTDLALFSQAYHSQSRTGLTTQRGHVSNFRVHVIDALRFRESLDFDLELWAWVGSEIAFHWVAYWYGRGITDEFLPLRAGDAEVFDLDTFRR